MNPPTIVNQIMNEKTMSRKKFMEYHGATNRNDRYGWAFVNHDDKVVILALGMSILNLTGR